MHGQYGMNNLLWLPEPSIKRFQTFFLAEMTSIFDEKRPLQGAYEMIKGWTTSKPPIKRLATQDQLSEMEIR